MRPSVHRIGFASPQRVHPRRRSGDGTVSRLPHRRERIDIQAHPQRQVRIPTSGVRALAEETAWIDDVRAVALVLPEHAVFSHFTAAHLLQVPVPKGLERPLHVTVPTGRARGKRQCVQWHHGAIESHTIKVGNLAVTDAERTWLDLGPHLPLPELVAATDLILRRNLVRELVIPAGARSAANLRQALALSDPRSRSPRESTLRVHLLLAGLPRPEVNYDIVHQGEWIGCGDLVRPEYRLYVEYDGEHHENPRQRHQDAQTRNALGQLGWSVRVVTRTMKLHDVVGMLTQDLVAGGWHPDRGSHR